MTCVARPSSLLSREHATGGCAAIKVHKVLSVGCGAPVQYHFSPAREHDSRPLQIDESWWGYGLLADLAYASLARLRAYDAHDVRLVIRLKGHWKPQVDDIARGRVTQEICPGTDLEAETLRLHRRAMDADVHMRGPKPPLHLRIVGVQTPQGSCPFLTHLPPRLGPLQVADRYRGRWEVERSIRLDKSVDRLDEVDTAQPCAPKTRPSQAGAPRAEAPLHPRLLAWQLAVSCQAMTEACHLKGVMAKPRWEKIAALLTQSAKDPNWRRRPPVLDQFHGGKRQRVVRKKTNHRN